MKFNARAFLLIVILILTFLPLIGMFQGLAQFAEYSGRVVNYVTTYNPAYGLITVILIINQIALLGVVLTELGREE